jgi:hypothetical protein
MPSSTPTVSRKRTRSTNVSESNDDPQQTTSTSTSTVPPKRQRNNPSRTNYSLRNRSVTSNAQRYNLRPRTSQSQVHLPEISTPHPTTVPSRTRRHIPSTIPNITPQEQPILPVTQSRQYRLVYISDDDDQQPTTTTTTQSTPTIVNTTFNLITDDEDDEPRRPQVHPRRTARSTTATRSRTITDPTNATPTTSENTNYSNGAVAHVRLNRAIEIVIDSIQSLEGAVNNFDQLVLGLLYGRLNTRTEFENFEGMIRLSRILNLNFPSRLTHAEIDALPKIKFLRKTDSTSSILLVEKCPICLTEFTDQEIINQLHCTHLFHLQCISTWLSENDSCPTCRRKVNGD